MVQSGSRIGTDEIYRSDGEQSASLRHAAFYSRSGWIEGRPWSQDVAEPGVARIG
jgi:hypothetical protein